MNSQIAIHLSNRGVEELSRGDHNAAFHSLSKAVNIVMMKIHNHVHVNDGSGMFVFSWENCASGITTTKEGAVQFLSLRALRISTTATEESEVERLCPCGYAWAIWFNLALCCSVIGTKMGEKGAPFLEMAYDLYDKIQHRVENEPSKYNRHWTMISMIVSNNQACIFYDLCMHDAAMQCLNKLATALASCEDNMGVEDRGEFCLNLQILGGHTVAAAA